MWRTLIVLFVCSALLIASVAGCAGVAMPTPTAPAQPTIATARPTAVPATPTPAASQPTPASAAKTIIPVEPGPKLSTPVKLGFISSLTGAISSSSTGNRRGFELAVDDFNAAGGFGGAPVQPVIYDDELKPQRATELTSRLITVDKVAGIVGYNASGCALSSIQIAQQYKIPVIITGGGVVEAVARYAKESQNYIFGLRMLERIQAMAVFKFMRDKRGVSLDKLAIIHDATGYGVEAKNDAISALAELGAKPCAVEQIQTGQKDATAEMQRIQQAGCQAAFWAGYETEFTTVMQSAKKIGWKGKFCTDWGLSQPSTYKLLGPELAEGVPFPQAFTTEHSPEAKALAARLQQKYGEIIFPLSSAQGYDGTVLLLKAISAAGSTEGPKVAQALESIAGFKGTTKIDAAPFSHADHEGLDKESQFFICEWKNGQIVVVD